MNLKKIFLFSAILPVLLAALIYYYARQDLLGGKTEIRGAYEDIDIYQMDLGLKLVEAKTFHGAIYGLGFALAKDRLWQMHFLRRLAFGRVSEVRDR